jgi:hypothetical protein
MMKYLFIFLILPIAFGFGPVGTMQPHSLDWQRIELEKSIKEQVQSVISPIIRSGEYIVSVQVRFSPTADLRAASAGGKKDEEKQKPKPRIKFNDLDPGKAKGDYVVMSKLGLEAPLYVDQPEREKAASTEEEVKQWQKFIVNYLNSYDLFKLLESVEVSVKLDNYLGDETKKTVEQLLQGLNLNYGSVKAKVKVSYLDMKEIKKSLDKRNENKNRELYEWIGRLGQPIGLILAVLILCAFAIMLFRKYAELQEKQMEMMGQMNRPQPPQKEETEKDKEDNGFGAFAQDPGEQSKEDGIERFRAMIQNNPSEASFLIKRWIKEPSKIHQSVLNVLVKELSGDELSKIFEYISMDERKNWKKYLGKAIRPEEIITAKRYVGTQVVQEMIIPNSITDVETVDLLIRITPEESANFCKNETTLAPIFMNVMNAKFLNRMMDRLSDDVVDRLLDESFKLTPEKVDHLLSEFKSKLQHYIKDETVSPFIEKLLELIPLSTPTREKNLYQSLARAAGAEKLIETARNYFPSELVFAVPDSMMKNFAQAMPREKRPELVFLLDGPTKDKFVSVIAPNEKSQDMLWLEIEKIERDSERKAMLLENRDIVLKEYVETCRKTLRSNSSYLKELEPLLSEWMKGLTQEKGQKSPVKLAA